MRFREVRPTFRQIILVEHAQEADGATALADTRDVVGVLRTTIAYQKRLRLLFDKPAMNPVKVHGERVQHRDQSQLCNKV